MQNAIDLAHALGVAERARRDPLGDGDGQPEGALDLEAAALCKMADRGQITGALLDGPLALDNAISPEAAAIKKHRLAGRRPRQRPGRARPRGRQHAGQEPVASWRGADAAGIVLGARVPIILTSRADALLTRLASCAVAVAGGRRAARQAAATA